MSDKPWGGRFTSDLAQSAARFSASVDVDRRLAQHDIRGSIAHARMLGARNIVSQQDADRMIQGLEELACEAQQDRLVWDPAHEDVHMNVEAALTARIGSAGARLHTGRSRNDQVATDLRLWSRQACEGSALRIDQLLCVIARRAGDTLDVLLPGYTHLQRAQPIRLAHHLLAWAEMLSRDRSRLLDAARRMDASPLGSGALAGTSFGLDREQTAKELGFGEVSHNSLDAVGDRDFLIEATAALAICAVHLSRIGEELVVWSSQEFGFVQMSDAFTTGSSMMPQKKNPDIAELVRGKCGRVVGDLVALLVLMKGLPLAYNRDLQEDKPPVFDAFDTVDACLKVLAGALAGAQFDANRMRQAAEDGWLLATDLADHLAAKGVPFRESHRIVGRLVARAQASGRQLDELSVAELEAEHAGFAEDVREVLDVEAAVERRAQTGGPARARVHDEIEALARRLRARGLDPERVAASFGVTTAVAGGPARE